MVDGLDGVFAGRLGVVREPVGQCQGRGAGQGLVEFFCFLLSSASGLSAQRLLGQPSFKGGGRRKVLGHCGQFHACPQQTDRDVVEVGSGAQAIVDVSLGRLVLPQWT